MLQVMDWEMFYVKRLYVHRGELYDVEGREIVVNTRDEQGQFNCRQMVERLGNKDISRYACTLM